MQIRKKPQGRENYRKNRGKRIRDKKHCEEIKTGEHLEPREQVIKRLKSLTNAKEILHVRLLDYLGRQQLGLAQAVEPAEELLELPGLRP